MGVLNLIGLFAKIIELIINVPFAFLEFFLSKEERIKRKIKKTKSKKLSEIKTGEYVKIHGVALRSDRIMHSPLSKKRCIGYEVLVGREMSDYYEDKYMKEEIIQKFYLSQDNKKILIIPNKANIDLKKENIGNSGLFKDTDSNMANFLKRHQTKSTSFGFNKSLNFKEGILEEGDKLTVVGKVTVLKSRDNKSQIVIRNLEEFPLFIKKINAG
tara:strand:+ start:56 stop:697 length:642 start_codon:yes stop_codon:yes gene_type:complete